MLNVRRVLKSAQAPQRGELIDLWTPWGEGLAADPEAMPLPEHPRPTLERERWGSLNGWWEYAIQGVAKPGDDNVLTGAEAVARVSGAQRPQVFDGRIRVPFSPEAPLSGVGRALMPHELLWYRRRVTLPVPGPGERLVLHVDAVDWACALFADGRLTGTHVGGYLPFDVDLTSAVRAAAPCEAPAGEHGDKPAQAEVELALCVLDPTDAGEQPRGKQRLEPGGIWYTAQSGIWQSVWWELVADVHLTSLALVGATDGRLAVEAGLSAEPAPGTELELVLLDADGSEALAAALAAGSREVRAELRLARPHLWSCDDPHLYPARLTLRSPGSACDHVRSYAAFRTVEVRPDGSGRPHVFLNGAPVFLRGVLDQGYWPDGLMTAPSDEALVRDISAMRAAGFNLLRKHIKVEASRWYWHCDRMGMLVWQDCVSGGAPYSAWHTSQKPTLFKATWGRFSDSTPSHQRALSAASPDFQAEWTETCREMVRRLKGHPSIVTWVLFNEGWGQFDARRACELVRAEDPTRPVDAVSGWYDQRCGDYLSEHNYFRPLTVTRDRHGRAFVLSEFGGLTWMVEGHAASPEAYGYGDFSSLEAWRDGVRDLLATADRLEARGLAGFVYTQLSDVEDEVNGLLTYDRRVNKLTGAGADTSA